MAKKVKDAMVAEKKKARYFIFSVDSTPDISHIDQLILLDMCTGGSRWGAKGNEAPHTFFH